MQLTCAFKAAAILRRLVPLLDRERIPADLALLEEAKALSRSVRRTLLLWQKAYAADPLVKHLFETRKAYCRWDEHATKSGNRVETNLLISYQTAGRLGFTDSSKSWEKLVRLRPG
jgi:hypothetical protein